jgi:hypothetical protein
MGRYLASYGLALCPRWSMCTRAAFRPVAWPTRNALRHAQFHNRILHLEATAQTPLERAIYSIEIADAIAADAAKLIPSCRLLRPEVTAAFMKIVRQQPEYRQKEIQQRNSILRLTHDNLPRHIPPLVQDFQTVNELMALARESATRGCLVALLPVVTPGWQISVSVSVRRLTTAGTMAGSSSLLVSVFRCWVMIPVRRHSPCRHVRRHAVLDRTV